jgi:serine phosphatase RsbU (regulator of sigma subunit)
MYNEQLLAVHPNDLLVFYTDGLSEVGKGVQVPAMLAKVQPGPDYHLRMLEAALSAGGASQFVDDVTVLTARIN